MNDNNTPKPKATAGGFLTYKQLNAYCLEVIARECAKRGVTFPPSKAEPQKP